MNVVTCQGFGGPAAQPADGPSPRRCRTAGEHWATVFASGSRPGAYIEAVLFVCPWHRERIEGRA